MLTPEQIERERVEFEAWMKVECAGCKLHRCQVQPEQYGASNTEIAWQAWLARAERALDIEQEHIDAISVLKFYASPDTYLAIGFFPDHPCGEFIEDFTICDGRARPGKRAREIFHKYNPKFEVGEPIDTAKNKP